MSSARVIYHPLADEEVIEAARYYAGQGLGLGADFLDAIDEAVALIERNPDACAVVDNERGVHRCPVRRFPFCLYYRRAIDVIRILAVKHHSRHPDYWKDRH